MKLNKPIIASYGRSALAAALAVYMADPNNIDIKAIVAAALAAIIPPLMRWLNPNDKSFGRTK